MEYLFDAVAHRLSEAWKRRNVARPGKSYRCQCGRPIFFRNSQCLSCGAQLGYVPALNLLGALVPGATAGTWRLHPIHGKGDAEYRRCANFDSAAGCNWLVPVADAQPWCVACRLNRTIPNLGDPENREHWARIEVAKRRLVAQLVALGLPIRSKVSEDRERGLMFDFLRSPPGGPAILTGHASGLITLNVEEADDARRERMRRALHEPYRTLLGHFRHEIGHYYWDRLVLESKWLAPFRDLFGDERVDYAAALKSNYEKGPPADWAQRYVSSYASTHPWEDWAETWAHYLHMVDTLDTALGFGLDADDVEGETDPFGSDALYAADDPSAAAFLAFLNSWIELTTVLNELARSMGQPDFYPFVMSKPVVAKLQFIHLVVREAHAAEVAATAAAA